MSLTYPGNELSKNTETSEVGNFTHLIDCLTYALAIDETTNLPATLGLIETLSNQEALSMWVKNEIQGVQFFDAGALFNFLIRQLDAFVFTIRREQ
ncbi:MAG: hypothetical protein ABL919_04070 [Methylococcales bacterium]